MKIIIAILFLFVFINSCKNSRDQQVQSQLLESAKLKKVKADKALADFKIIASAPLRQYDSAKAKGTIPQKLQNTYDSLMKEGIRLAMQSVYSQMDIEKLEKNN